MGATDITIRQARPDDYEGVAKFTRETWADRESGDYIPEIYHEWIAGDGDRQRTFLADAGDDVAGICQGVCLSDHEAWAQGMRVNPDYRGEGLSTQLNDALFRWARERGATVVRNMVFSWNAAGLGGSRAVGFAPLCEFRWAHPDPDPDATLPEPYTITADADAAWSFWRRSDAQSALSGLALDADESWAMAELTREGLHRAADETRVFAVSREDDTTAEGGVSTSEASGGSSEQGSDGADREDDGTRAMAHRVRDYERETDGGIEQWAEYGVGAWTDLGAARALFRAISADAAAVGADRTRVLVPETPRHVSDAAAAHVAMGENPDFVLEAALV
ncbi:GNAT family N-acetyltransferase [Halococcus agarilyticus]|uniref:GNAT family N-acetyltransferase n=1 Tax=Halococcus agarilyticus TaxID=1232219 RepID=UPI0006776A1A|nr:GNAT family N-acetyltransferase [Halococcus agarilyticus]